MLFSWLTNSRSKNASGRARVSLEREGNERIQRLSQVVHQVHWTRSILGIMWTAGPATMLALFGGYMLAYGKPPPTQTLLYFFTVTIISGLIALFAKVVYNLTHGHLAEQAEEDISEVIDKLGDLILAVGDLIVENNDCATRPREAALRLLRRIELSPDGVALAAQELTNDPKLAAVLGQIENYRRAGLYSRVRDLNAQHQKRIETALTKLQEIAPEATSLLKERFYGLAPQLDKGVPRDEYFIERTLAAIEEDNPVLMTLQDVEEMLILAFELISGRKIPMLTFNYSGKWKLARQFHDLEEKRSRYRNCQAGVSNRIRALASFLVETQIATPEQLPYGVGSSMKLQKLEQVIDRLAAEVKHLAHNHESNEQITQLRAQAEILGQALFLYKSARSGYKKLGRAHIALIEATAKWQALTAKLTLSDNQVRLGPGRKDLRITEQLISLTDRQKVTFCQHLVEYLHGKQLEKRGRRFFTSNKGKAEPLTLEGARYLAIEIALALEPHIQLANPGIQRGLNASNATYLGGLQPDLSAAEKAALGATMAAEVQQDMSKAAERLALALVKHYRVDLTESARKFLVETYGARLHILDMLANSEVSASNKPQSSLNLRPPVIAAPKREWYKALINARQELL